MNKLIGITCLIWFSLINCAFGALVSGLYQVEVSVPSQSPEIKEQAVSDGFLQVLRKVSGDAHIDKNPHIKPILGKADYYVQELSYSNATTDSSQYLLQIHYNAADINRLLKDAGIPYWGQDRPSVLVWMTIIDQKQNVSIVDSDTSDMVLTGMVQQGKNFGLPLIFPIMDVKDVEGISAKDVMEMDLPVIQQASKRYKPDALLIGKIDESKGDVQSEWQLVLNQDQWDWTASGRTLDEVINLMMGQITHALAKHYIVKNTNTAIFWLKLEVNNITRQDDIAALTKHLKQVPFVKQVELSQIAGSTVSLSVLVHGSREAFVQNPIINQRLSLKSEDDATNKLTYVWIH